MQLAGWNAFEIPGQAGAIKCGGEKVAVVVVSFDELVLLLMVGMDLKVRRNLKRDELYE